MAAWAGLGYYARARNLKKCAEAVARDHGGVFPDTEEGLKALPGIGDYTAAAVAAIAFNRQAAVMDGNVERVISRLYAISTPLPAAKPLMKQKVARADAGGPTGRFRAGDDGSRRDDLYAEAPGLRALSVQRIMRGAAAA
jgi:A/G-specific adenine glycosylase